jgi:hypothetical protein
MRGPDNGGSDGGGDLSPRVAKLEAHMDHLQSDVREIKSILGGLASQFHHLPTKQDLSNNVMTMVLIGLTVLLLGVGGIIGGLAWIEPKPAPQMAPSSAPAPLIFQIPSQAQSIPSSPQAPALDTKKRPH